MAGAGLPPARSLLQVVEWRDLVALRGGEVVRELSLPVPWLLASLVLAAHGLQVPALAASFMFFLAGLRVVHNAYHHALGLSRRGDDRVMLVLSVAMLGSMQAVRVNHLRHHRFCMGAGDVEAFGARLAWWQAILAGPAFPFLLHHEALRVGTRRERRAIAIELAANAAWLVLVFGVLEQAWLQYHVLAMLAGQSLTAFFAVWTVHHDCDPRGVFARTIRDRFKSVLTLDMFYHVEHHLFPAVPTRRLQRLARRLDAVAPSYASKRVF